MRADRLVATLLFLQSRGTVTAAQLADELEISVRTARRDLEALAMAGVPVYSRAGKGGGWSLVGGARTDLTGLNADEVRTLFLLTGPSSTVSPDAKAALRKLVQALPSTLRADAEAAASAVVVDPASWRGWDRRAPEHLTVLQQAVIDGVQVRLGYVDRSDTSSTRLVHPLGLVDKAGVWYLVAGTDRGRRTFHLGRVRSVERTDLPVDRPEGFSLAAAWAEVVESVVSTLPPAHARVLVPAAAIGAFRGQFGRSAEVLDALADGTDRVEVVLRGESHDMLARQLAGWGRLVQVVEPREVTDTLIRIGRELVGLEG
jgi:predicted DNA-binding transcriptional regulator YafY